MSKSDGFYANPMRRVLHAAVLLAGLLVMSACAPPVVSRECSFARPLIFSHHSIAGLDDDDARALLILNRQIVAVCGAAK